MRLPQKIASIIGFSFPMYGYAYIFKDNFDLCTHVFVFTILYLLAERELEHKEYSYVAILYVMMLSVAYAMFKQLFGIGTVYIFADKIMWVLIPCLIILILILDVFMFFKNANKR